MVRQLLESTDMNLEEGVGIYTTSGILQRISNCCFSALDCEDIFFDGQFQSEKRINLLYDETERR